MEEKKTNLKESENTEPIHKHYSVSQSRILAGVILVVAGLLMIMKNAGFFTDFIDDVIFSWPMLLIVIGLLITVGSTENKVTGIIIMAVGAFFIIPVIFREAFHMYNMFWPSVFIIIGIILIFSRRGINKPSGEIYETDEGYISIVYIFSGGERRIENSNFKGGKVTAVFGGGEINLVKSALAQGVNILEIVCVFGRVTIIVPDEWDIKIEVTPVLGGFRDGRELRAERISEPEKKLIIRGAIVFGGGEVKSV
ncbi:MAG: hypothetical protein KA114_05480 [Bacteroidales bacterium]|nr:hypothetical protein [Bacteroidales bacterium]